MSYSPAGKGDTPRRSTVSQKERELRWDFAYGLITREQFKEGIEDARRKENARN